MRKLIIAIGIIAAILAFVISFRAKGQLPMTFGDLVICRFSDLLIWL